MPVPTIHVLLATYNGARHLPRQWASLQEQEGVDVVVHVADDGSTDGTARLLDELAGQPRGAIRAVHRLAAPPRRSATRSFLLLLVQALQDPRAQWFAYCDQDDVWLPGKLQAAHAALAAKEGSTEPALYGGRTFVVDDDDQDRGLSRALRRPPSFRNAITQNIMGGNTMLLNRAAASLVAGCVDLELVTHDWLTYQLVTGAGGHVHHDARPFVRYRQHGGNAIGSNIGWRARWARLVMVLQGEYRAWNTVNAAALAQRSEVLTPENRAVLEAFGQARTAATPWRRALWLARSGAYRQSPPEQAMLWVACILRRL
ncbi:glycosyltransferase [Ramlibacter sp. USB13]|uniref:Glycosyltransferase n=1 Tax=Ramlibacter cellulosilyticus TaxID=2764187 RepID=A0A923SEH7_9BURK|nr:glycosyltransferase [Ramlibacter cellulosilyticus]MBC5786298.1 glycosyltransferase [Ramlibacter cellulosilyticus]